MNAISFLIAAALGLIVMWALDFFSPSKLKKPKEPFPEMWRIILNDSVGFYHGLNDSDKDHFEYKVHFFLLNVRVTGIQINITQKDKILLAASAVIPIFHFKNWWYTNLNEVLVYEDSFNDQFETKGPGRNILGMVGGDYLQGKMAISIRTLHHGFRNEQDKNNTAVHEMAHLIDYMDGSIDGIPHVLIGKEFVIPWIDLMDKEIQRIREGKSDIRPYGGTSRTEFFAVASEYFFERPKLFEKKHPELYQLMCEIFDQKMAKRNLGWKRNRIRKNAPCPCDSKKTFRACCGHEHF